MSRVGSLGPTVSRTIDALAADTPRTSKAIDAARAAARARAWALAGVHAPGHNASAERPLVIDLDATLITAHSEKEQAAPTFKRGSGSTRCRRSLITGKLARVSR